ncbi:hypothetical protein [Bradyrhizobium sp. cir1]|uniref:hypothetical protein n=1 Tax=Bradyrhizobium sp. cir1 TaxID=1445730 RepID=UPI001AED54A0|nr:hypothetical protein [Bradyrhizobium sp. cir1]
MVIPHDDACIRTTNEMPPIVRFEPDDMIWRIGAIRLNRCHRHLLRKNERLYMQHCLKPRGHEARYRRHDWRWRSIESVTLQSQTNISPFRSNIVARFDDRNDCCSHPLRYRAEGLSKMKATKRSQSTHEQYGQGALAEHDPAKSATY